VSNAIRGDCIDAGITYHNLFVRLCGGISGESRADITFEQIPNIRQLCQQVPAGILSHFPAIAAFAFLDSALVSIGTFYLLGKLGMDLTKNITDNEFDV
jgi:hypothetical protein